MEPQKDKWIDDVLSSLNGIQRAEPEPFLYARIRHHIDSNRSAVYVSARTVWLAAASFALLLLLNWQIVSRQPVRADSTGDALNTVVSEMQLYPASHQPYDLWSAQDY